MMWSVGCLCSSAAVSLCIFSSDPDPLLIISHCLGQSQLQSENGMIDGTVITPRTSATKRLPDWFQDFQLRYHCYHHSGCVIQSFDGDSLIHGFCFDVFAPCGDGLCCWRFGVTCYGHLQDWSFEVFLFFKSCLLFLLQMHTPFRVNQASELDTSISCIHSNGSGARGSAVGWGIALQVGRCHWNFSLT